MSCCGNNNNGGNDGSDEAKAMITGLPLRHTVVTPGAGGACFPTPSVAPCVTNVCSSTPLCNTCNFTPCRCSVPFSPRVARSACEPCAVPAVPYYVQAPRVCAEDNRQYIRTQVLTGVFKNKAAFAMPTCGASIRVLFDTVGDVPIGAWLWSNGLGYLTIQGFNPETGEIQLLNECPTSNCVNQAAPGTPIPKCSLFVVLAPNCGGGSQGPGTTFPYLNSGFVAPDDGDCIDIAVTNTNGLSVNALVAITTGTYRVSAIKSATLITICNDGQGLTPGTVVNYIDSAGNLLVPITLIQSDPCLNTAVLSGLVLACHAGATQPLVGTLQDQILVWDESLGTDGEWVAKTLGIPTLNCTELTVALTLDPALPSGTPYLVTLTSTAAFTAADLVVIGVTQFTVDSVVDGTHMYIIPVVDPTVITVYNSGSTLCSAGCCEELSNAIDELTTRTDSFLVDNVDPDNSDIWLDHVVDSAISTNISATTIGTTVTATGNIVSLVITNGSATRTMKGMIDFSWTWIYDMTCPDLNGESCTALGYGDTGSGSFTLLGELPETHIATADSGVNRHSNFTTIAVPFTLAPNAVVTFRARADLRRDGGEAASTFTTFSQLARIAVDGVAVTV